MVRRLLVLQRGRRAGSRLGEGIGVRGGLARLGGGRRPILYKIRNLWQKGEMGRHKPLRSGVGIE